MDDYFIDKEKLLESCSLIDANLLDCSQKLATVGVSLQNCLNSLISFDKDSISSKYTEIENNINVVSNNLKLVKDVYINVINRYLTAASNVASAEVKSTFDGIDII